MWNVCTKEGNPTILISVDDPVPEGYIVEAETSNSDYLLDSVYSTGTKVTRLSFRNRFTATEKVMLEMACLDNPAGTMQQRQQAAMLRVFLKDLDNASYVDLSRPDTQYGVRLLETLGLLATGRANTILNTPPTAIEAYRE